jgi:hypothetical protein
LSYDSPNIFPVCFPILFHFFSSHIATKMRA